jgi:hypothetical protein
MERKEKRKKNKETYRSTRFANPERSGIVPPNPEFSMFNVTRPFIPLHSAGIPVPPERRSLSPSRSTRKLARLPMLGGSGPVISFRFKFSVVIPFNSANPDGTSPESAHPSI